MTYLMVDKYMNKLSYCGNMMDSFGSFLDIMINFLSIFPCPSYLKKQKGNQSDSDECITNIKQQKLLSNCYYPYLLHEYNYTIFLCMCIL